jgi:hypothetical protein
MNMERRPTSVEPSGAAVQRVSDTNNLARSHCLGNSKPNHMDYSLPKSYRPIVLLECVGMLLEKALARRIYYDLNTYSFVPTNQLGGRVSSFTLDAGLVPLHDAQLSLAQ